MRQNKQKNDVAVMTVAYNKVRILEKCILGFIKSGTKCKDIYIVDNGSTDNIRSLAQKHNVRYMRLDKNHFISHALNVGFSHFNIANNYRYFLISGSDVLVDKHTVSEQIKTMRSDHTIGMTGPAHFDIESNVLMNYGVTINPLTSTLRSNLDPQQKDHMNHFHSMYMVRAKTYQKLGGLDAVLFPMIYEEPDFGERMITAGFKIKICSAAHIWHSLDHASVVGAASLKIHKERLYNSPAKAYLFFRNRIIYMRLHSSLIQFLFFILCIHPLIIVYYAASIEPRYRRIAGPGIIDGLIFSVLKNRAYISKRNAQVLHI